MDRQEADSWPQRDLPRTEDSKRPQHRRDPTFGGDAERESLAPEDVSHAGSWLRYASFVVGLAAAASATLVVTPVVLPERLRQCRDGCLTLEQDLRLSLDSSVHPCDDFYGHVCKGWDSSENRYLDPLGKYEGAFSQRLVRGMLLEKVHQRSSRARGKAAGFLFRCLSREENINSSVFTAFLHDLGLPWPSKSPATRYQLLNILVRSSLQYGMPMFWGFYVGRHPFLPSENAIYMTLDPRCVQWIRDIEALSANGNADDYLRRCAEIVGGTGQSYSVMIRHVLTTHDEVPEMVRLFWGEDSVPQFHNLSEPELRRANNGHLPDDSQLWPVDEMVNLHPELYAHLDSELLNRSSDSQERFKLFLGAYVVWALSPMVSGYLTKSLFEDMGHVGSQHYKVLKCIEALELLMPMIKWHLHRDLQKDLGPTWNVVRMAKLSMQTIARSYSISLSRQVGSILGLVATNAFNMTSTWDMLDDAFAYLPNDTTLPFFELYRKAAQSTVSFFKQSLRRPGHSVYHVPGIASIRTYRLLVAREVHLKHFLNSAPLYSPLHPMTVRAALAGTIVTTQINVLLRISLFYDHRFKEYQRHDIDPGMIRLYGDILRLRAALNASRLLPDASMRESHEVYLASFAALTASNLPAIQLHTTGGDDAALSQNGQKLSWGLPAEQLFFYLYCFTQCGKVGRELQTKMAICNVALPAVLRFRRAFKCGSQHRLATPFTWPDIVEPSTAAP